MRFGVTITSEEFGDYATGLLAAASDRGWECRCFLTDRGTRVLRQAPFQQLVESGRVSASVCELSWDRFGDGEPPSWVVMGGQYQNAELVHQCDKVVVF